MQLLSEDFYTAKELANLLRYKTQHIRDMIKAGKIRVTRVTESSDYRIPREEVQRLIDGTSTKTT